MRYEKGGAGGLAILIISIVILCVVWIPLCGLRVLKPQEALVLTLCGKYQGTIKGDGFYCVNPFCTAVNPAASTKLAQSGDTQTKEGDLNLNALISENVSSASKKVSKNKSYWHLSGRFSVNGV